MEGYNRPININISTFTIVKIVAFFLLLYFLYLIRDIVVILFISLILSSAVDPWIDWLQARRLPRVVGILLIYLVLFGIVSLVIYLIIPPIAQQVGELADNLPYYLEKITANLSSFEEYSARYKLLDNIKSSLGTLSSNLKGATSGVFSTISNIFGGIFSFFLVLVITFYMTAEENSVKKLVWSLAPEKHQPYILQLINRMQKKIGLWLRGQLILSLIIFALTFVGLSLMHVKYALVLALIAGITEFVPYLGPVLGAIPAVFLVFTQSPLKALAVVVLYLVIQWAENNILVPKVMQKTVGLNPLVSITVLLIGFQIAGIVGAILSIPVATALDVFARDLFSQRLASK